jgi:hypothetical protein
LTLTTAVFAVQVLRGIRFPEMLEWGDDRVSDSYVVPDEALAEVVHPLLVDPQSIPGAADSG